MTTCTLCDLPTSEPPVTDDGVDGAFCCRGCLEVSRTLGDGDLDGPETVRDALGADDDSARSTGETAYLAVDGMHCATCEAFIEATATKHEGVLAADASYPSDMVKLVYDPDAVSRSDLPSIVDGLGYRAREFDPDSGTTSDDREHVGRLLVGGFFGMMVMVWYVLFLYPVYLGVHPDGLLLDVTGSAGRYLLANIWAMTTVVVGYTGFPILRGAYVSLRSGHPNMDLLVGLATITAYTYSTIAALLGHAEVYFDIAVVIVLVVMVGNYYEGRIKRRAAGHVTELVEERLDEARRRTADGVETVPVDALGSDDEVIVRTGERIPIDGTVIEGTAAVDEALVTGESLPHHKRPGDAVIGGAVVTNGALVVEVDAESTSTIDRLMQHLWDIQSSRPGVQRLADRLAAVFVPLVIVLALLAFGWHLSIDPSLTSALLTGLAVLVVSCPCALGLATPLAVASGVRGALTAGIVITDASVFERAAETDIVAFDKTGTLTTGAMRVVDVETAVEEDGDDSGDDAEDLLLRRAAAVEQFSDHPVADALMEHVGVPDASVDDFERHPGRGVSATVDRERVLVGRSELFTERGWSIPDWFAGRVENARGVGRIPVLIGWAGAVRGIAILGDRPRPEWDAVVSDLAATDRRIVVITGDDDRAAARFRDHPRVERVFAGVPPEAKAAIVDRLRTEGTTAMVGDGSNDAPALAAADLGIALESGTKLAADAADVIVTTDDLTAVPRIFDLTAATNRRIRQNLAWAFCYNAVAIPLALVGLINPLFAALAMTASSLLVVGNSSRSL